MTTPDEQQAAAARWNKRQAYESWRSQYWNAHGHVTLPQIDDAVNAGVLRVGETVDENKIKVRKSTIGDIKMTELDLRKLEIALTEAIEDLWENDEILSLINVPLVGENVHSLMAQAALCVLCAVSNTQDYLKREGMLTE